jgi:predicted ATPase/class 3 adenylate cyclase
MTYITSLASHIPIDRRLALVEDVALPERTRGAALFADVSGFTPLTLALMRELGPKRGAEELLIYLNPVFDSLVNELHRYGGAVISFAGDAITCWLDGDDGRRAIACALGMQEVMKAYQNMRTSGGTQFSLYIKVAIAAGPGRRLVVGSGDVQKLDVLAGETLLRMAAVEKLADRGEVVVEAPLLTQLDDLVEVGDWRPAGKSRRAGLVSGLSRPVEPEPWPASAVEVLAEAQVKEWLLPPVPGRLRAGQAFLAELRPVVVLFMNFSGLDYDQDDAVGQKLDKFIRWVQTVVTRYDGYLLQLMVGDKGSTVYVSFGAPIAHDDNAVRAVAAALDLRARATSFEGIEQVQLGLSAGPMWTGAYGGTQRSTYGIMGNETNMAARLMAKAEAGQILVSEQVVAAAERHYHFHDLGQIQVKGRDEPMPVWDVAGRRAGASGEWALFAEPVVGRQVALTQLDAALKAVLAGQGRVVRLTGEAGMGKSHVAAQFSHEAVDEGLNLVLGACQSITRSVAYHPWRQIFRTLLDLDQEAVSEEEAVADLTRYVEEHHPVWLLRLPLLGDLLALPLPDNPTTAAFDPGLRQKTLISLAVEMVQTWAQERPLLLVVENAHWLDEASLALTQALAQQALGTQPILLLLVYRPGMLGDEPLLPGLEESSHLAAVELPEMPEDEMNSLVHNRLGGPPSRLLLSVIQIMARGNPFFVLELVDSMNRSDQLARQEDGAWNVGAEIVSALQGANYLFQLEGEWDLRPDANLSALNIGLPDSIHGIILSRLDRLPESHKITLKVSSVIGRYFDLNLLAESHPEDKELEALRDEAEHMEAEQVVHEELRARTTYAFRHHTTHEVAYETLLYTQRQQLHQAVAQALVELEAEAIPQIAHHAFLGQVWPLALQYNLQAGQLAQQLYANQQGIEFYRKALQSATELPESDTTEQRLAIQLALGELLVSTGQYDEAGEQLAQALSLADAQGDLEAQARACRWFGRSHELRGEYPAAVDWLDRGLATLDGQTSSEGAEILLIAGLIQLRQGEYDTTLELCRRSLRLADSLTDAAVRARTYNLMGIVDRRRGESEAAVNRFRQSLAQYEHLHNVYGQATSHNLIANGLFAQGHWTESDQHYRQSLNLFTQLGDSYNQVLVNNNLGGIALKQGRLEAALGYYERAVRQLEQSGGSQWVLGALQMNTANTLIQRGELEAATGRLLMAEDYFERAQLRDLLPELYALSAELALRQGHPDEARSHGRRSLDLARELEMPPEEGHTLRLMGEIAQAQQQFEQAEQQLQAADAILTDAGDEYEIARARLSLARLYAAQEQTEPALAALTSAEEIFQRLGAALDLEQIQTLRQELRSMAT